MQLVLSWPVRLLVVGILVFSLFIDGAGYVYRIANHYPLTGNVPGLPPNFGGVAQLFFHSGLDLAGGTHIDYQLTNFPADQDQGDVQQKTIDVIHKRVNALNVSEPRDPAPRAPTTGSPSTSRGVNAEQAQRTIWRRLKLVYTNWVPDDKATAGPQPRVQTEAHRPDRRRHHQRHAGDRQRRDRMGRQHPVQLPGRPVFDTLTHANVALPWRSEPVTGTPAAPSVTWRSGST